MRAYNDILNNWWTGDAKSGHLRATDGGLLRAEGEPQGFLWEHTTVLFGFETLYAATQNKEFLDRIWADWEFFKRSWPNRNDYVDAGGHNFNWAQDDAGWNAMFYMMIYKRFGDEDALELAGELIRNSYEFWKDGDVANGLLYDHEPHDEKTRHKSLHMASLIIAALDYLEARKDEALEKDTMAIYNWVENNMLRKGSYRYLDGEKNEKLCYCDDMLYWFNYNVNRVGKPVYNGPEFGDVPHKMDEGLSDYSKDRLCSVFLGCNFAMAAIHARLYRKTGDEKYLLRTKETVRALNDCETLQNNGVYRNSGDAWTNAQFMLMWIEDALTLPGVCTAKDIDLLKNTAQSIIENTRTPDGYYGACWSGPWDDTNEAWAIGGWSRKTIMANGTTTHMVFAAALAEKLFG